MLQIVGATAVLISSIDGFLNNVGDCYDVFKKVYLKIFK